jgi:hypothetical protein
MENTKMNKENKMKNNNIIKIQVQTFRGVTLEIDTAKISKETHDYFAKELETEEFKIWETLNRQSYFVGGVQAVTVPLKKCWLSSSYNQDNLIFVNSKQPKAKRKRIRHITEQKND